jgi:hypothetical protein
MYAQLTRRGQRFPDDSAFGFLKAPGVGDRPAAFRIDATS